MADITEQDLEGKTLDEIRALEAAAIAEVANPGAAAKAEADAAAAKKAEEDAAKLSDIDNSADGADDEEDDAQIDAPKEFTVSRTIDLGDGSGTQVFSGKGASREEAALALADSLANAQTHATKKLHELSKTVKEATKVKTYTEEEEFIYSQELMSKPTEAFKKLFKETTGYDIQDFKNKVERVDAFEVAQRSNAVQQAFIESHPDFIANPDNAKKIAKQCELNGDTEFTAEGLEKAYLALKTSGLLKLKAEGADVDTERATDTKERIVPPQVDATQQRSRRSSTIQSRGRTVPAKVEPTEDELYAMPLDKLRALANKQLAGE